MNINKILILVWFLLSSILLIENMVQPLPYIFIWWASTWQLSLISVAIWMWVWYWLKWFISKPSWDDDNYDF